MKDFTKYLYEANDAGGAKTSNTTTAQEVLTCLIFEIFCNKGNYKNGSYMNVNVPRKDELLKAKNVESLIRDHSETLQAIIKEVTGMIAPWSSITNKKWIKSYQEQLDCWEDWRSKNKFTGEKYIYLHHDTEARNGSSAHPLIKRVMDATVKGEQWRKGEGNEGSFQKDTYMKADIYALTPDSGEGEVGTIEEEINYWIDGFNNGEFVGISLKQLSGKSEGEMYNTEEFVANVVDYSISGGLFKKIYVPLKTTKEGFSAPGEVSTRIDFILVYGRENAPKTAKKEPMTIRGAGKGVHLELGRAKFMEIEEDGTIGKPMKSKVTPMAQQGATQTFFNYLMKMSEINNEKDESREKYDESQFLKLLNNLKKDYSEFENGVEFDVDMSDFFSIDKKNFGKVMELTSGEIYDELYPMYKRNDMPETVSISDSVKKSAIKILGSETADSDIYLQFCKSLTWKKICIKILDIYKDIISYIRKDTSSKEERTAKMFDLLYKLYCSAKGINMKGHNWNLPYLYLGN